MPQNSLISITEYITFYCRIHGGVPRYQRDILETNVITHFDNHTLATRPVFMDDSMFSVCSDGFPTAKCNHYHSLASMKPQPQSNITTCGTFWVDMYVKFIRQSTALSDPIFSPGHEKMY